MSILANWAFAWEEVRRELPQGSGLCLDLGCGTGCHREWVESAGWTWVGLDIDAEAGGLLIRGDVLCLPIKDESVGLVLLWQVLEHLRQPWGALAEVSRVLKPGGFVAGSVSCLEPFHDVCSYFGFTHKGIEQVLWDCGFRDIQLWPGLNAFSLIARSWCRRLLGPRGEGVAFPLVRGVFVSSLWGYLALRWSWNMLKRGRLGEDYRETVRWLAHDAPFEFAGHLAFVARKPGGSGGLEGDGHTRLDGA